MKIAVNKHHENNNKLKGYYMDKSFSCNEIFAY